MLSPQVIQLNISYQGPTNRSANDFCKYLPKLKQSQYRFLNSLSVLGRAGPRIHMALSRILFGGPHDISATYIKLFLFAY